MSFISLEFVTLLTIAFLLVYLIPSKQVRIKNLSLLLISYIFYGLANKSFVLLLIFSTVVDYFCAHLIERTSLKQRKKDILFISIFTNLSLLVFFKYYFFIATNINTIWNFFDYRGPLPYISIILPVAISFYTFQTIGYTVDVYKGKIKAEKNFIDFALYVSYFPQLVAGPIERASNLLPQLKSKSTFNLKDAKDGVLQISWGFLKKIVIAENLNIITSRFYSNIDEFTWIETVISLAVFSIHIYCDFSGYTDIAIGSAKLLGVKLLKNFDHPYGATSLSQLWKKWHISLTSWFGDYIHKELLSFKFFKNHRVLALFIIFTIMGAWHGASWAFISFGIFNAIGILIERGLIKVEKKYFSFIPHQIKNIYARFRTQFFWILCGQGFVASNLVDMGKIYKKLITNTGLVPFRKEFIDLCSKSNFIFVMVTWIAIYITEEIISKKKVPTDHRLFWPSLFCIWIVLILIGQWHQAEFIYFRF